MSTICLGPYTGCYYTVIRLWSMEEHRPRSFLRIFIPSHSLSPSKIPNAFSVVGSVVIHSILFFPCKTAEISSRTAVVRFRPIPTDTTTLKLTIEYPIASKGFFAHPIKTGSSCNGLHRSLCGRLRAEPVVFWVNIRRVFSKATIAEIRSNECHTPWGV